ncbi:hypothetical protein D3C72_2310420 [compost metagenome]
MLLLVRAFVEIDIMNPYHVGSFLLYFAAGKLTIRQGRRVVSERRLAEGRVLASHHPQLRF